MLEFLIGVASGIISGIGMGGGTILIFSLSVIMGLEQHVAQATNLIFFIPTSISAIIVNIRNKNIDIRLAFIISILGIIGAGVGAKLATHTDVKELKKYFGYFLGLITIHEIYSTIKWYIKSKKMHNKTINNKL